MDELEALVYLTVGSAAMCWDKFPTGAFNETTALALSKHLIAAIKAHEEEVIKREKAAWTLSHPHIIRDGQGNIIAQSRASSGQDFFVDPPVKGTPV